MNRRRASIAVIVSMLGGLLCVAQETADWRAMNQPMEPFRILGNLYYVGASDITSFLVTTPAGHILIDGGFAETAPRIERSITKLGFNVKDVRILLNSHAHLDHAGGLARLKEITGAKLMASEGDAPYLEGGGSGDPLMLNRGLFPPVKVDRRLKDNDIVELGGVTLTARVTAGHTPGCTSWVFDVSEGGKNYVVVSIGSLTILPGTRLTGAPTWPGIAASFTRSFATLRSIPCDVFLAAHGSFFELADKRKAQLSGAKPNPFVDRAGYRAYLDRAEQRFREQLDKEKAE